MERKVEQDLGGKGNGLVWLSQNTDLGYHVPKFEVIDASYYDEYTKQPYIAQFVSILHNVVSQENFRGAVVSVPRRLEEKCRKLADTFSGKEIAVRSSGVISEDNERLSGAGMYDTFFIEENELNEDSLKQAVINVYGSVNSEKASQYRKESGLAEERMAVIVQEFAEGYNGVAMSRLPGRAGIVPVSWSRITGAVVGGDKDALIHRAYFAKSKYESYRAIFQDEMLDSFSKDFDLVNEKLVPLVQKLRKRYGQDFELEFTFDPYYERSPDNQLYINDSKGRINLLQIRPLTNIQDKEITFPDKEPIFTAELCMGVGEYIGPWASTMAHKNIVGVNWKEPSHYAYVAPRLEKTLQRYTSRFLDLDTLTQNKKAIVLTHQAFPGMHALTIANERGLICLAKNNPERSNNELIENYGLDRIDLSVLLADIGGMSRLDKPKFKVPLNEIGEYIHIVSDGLNGYVYRATEQEAREFAEKNSLKFE